ncbi:MAG: peptidylprolyl isomerase [Pseudomonadota bacterium]
MNTLFRGLTIALTLSASFSTLFATSTLAADAKPGFPQVKIETSVGAIVVELNAQKAPQSVANFLKYVDDGFYTNTIFHRVIRGFMVQGGGFTSDMRQKPTRAAIPNEADNGLLNDRGTIAMARTGDPHSATAQFFINTVDNKPLNFRAKSGNDWGYAVFGKVVDGMKVVDQIERVQTDFSGPMSDVPQTPIIIKKVSRM